MAYQSGNLGSVTLLAQARYEKHLESLPRASLILTAERGELHIAGIALSTHEALGLLRDAIKLLENEDEYAGTDKDLK